MATDAAIEVEVRLTMHRMSPAVAALAHATGEQPTSNRRARRKAAAQAHKGVVGPPPVVVDQDVESLVAEVRTAFADAHEHVERASEQRLAEMVSRYHRNRQFTWEWMRVQALQGRIIDTLTPEERAARLAAFDEECRRIEAMERAAALKSRELTFSRYYG